MCGTENVCCEKSAQHGLTNRGGIVRSSVVIPRSLSQDNLLLIGHEEEVPRVFDYSRPVFQDDRTSC